jgi:hypothetical protein
VIKTKLGHRLCFLKNHKNRKSWHIETAWAERMSPESDKFVLFYFFNLVGIRFDFTEIVKQ